jgi:hypothetical protein
MSEEVKDVLRVKELDFAGTKIVDIPTTDPEVVGQVWSNGGVLTISSGGE